MQKIPFILIIVIALVYFFVISPKDSENTEIAEDATEISEPDSQSQNTNFKNEAPINDSKQDPEKDKTAAETPKKAKRVSLGEETEHVVKVFSEKRERFLTDELKVEPEVVKKFEQMEAELHKGLEHFGLDMRDLPTCMLPFTTTEKEMFENRDRNAEAKLSYSQYKMLRKEHRRRAIQLFGAKTMKKYRSYCRNYSKRLGQNP